MKLHAAMPSRLGPARAPGGAKPLAGRSGPGNQAMQRLLAIQRKCAECKEEDEEKHLQRQAAPGQTLKQLAHSAQRRPAAKWIQRQNQPAPAPAPALNLTGLVFQASPAEEAVRRYLSMMWMRLSLSPVPLDTLVGQVRANVPEAASQPLMVLRAWVQSWATENKVPLPQLPLIPGGAGPVIPPAPPSPGLEDSAIVQGVKKAFTTLIDGVTLRRGRGSLNISVSGLTAELKKGSLSAAVEVSPTGTFGVETSAGPLHLSGEISSDRWQVQLSLPSDTPIPDLSQLTSIFTKAEGSMRSIAGEMGKFRNLSDIPDIKDRMKPHVQPVKDAMDAAKGIAKATPGLSAGITIGSPEPGPGAPTSGIPAGVQVTAGVTLVF